MKIYLCRHGETTGDIEDRYGGDYDDHLTDLGKSEAKELAEQLAGKNIEKIFSSSRIRAQETAQILNQILNVDIETVADLRERNQYGILTGLVKSEAKEKYRELAEQLKDFRNTIEGAESYESFDERVQAALIKISQQNFKVAAIVTHGGPIKAILRRVEFHEDFKIKDCAFVELEVVGAEVKIVGMNGVEPKD